MGDALRQEGKGRQSKAGWEERVESSSSSSSSSKNFIATQVWQNFRAADGVTINGQKWEKGELRKNRAGT